MGLGSGTRADDERKQNHSFQQTKGDFSRVEIVRQNLLQNQRVLHQLGEGRVGFGDQHCEQIAEQVDVAIAQVEFEFELEVLVNQ